MLLDRANWRRHRPWLIGCALALLGALAWFLAAGFDSVHWPGGSTIPGFTFGIIGALIIVFEFLLWPRKKVRAWPIGSAQTWLRAHIWLGLLCLPILILHSGLRLGGTLSTVLMVVLVLVIASGVWGLILQNLLPVQMVEEMSAETSFAQQAFLVGQLLADADRLVAATCGATTAPAREEAPEHEAHPVIVATVRLTMPRAPAAAIAETDALAVFYREQVVPFLRDGLADSPLTNATRAAAIFDSIRIQVPPAAHEIVDALERFCQQRRHWDRQARLHFWLHNWLWIHFPLSVALLVLMAAHIFVALKFW